MPLKLRCSNCNKLYICFVDNTRIYGPIIETTCPHCDNFVQRNLSKFTEMQVEEELGHTRIARAAAMQYLARAIGKLVNDDDPSKPRKRKKRKKK